MLETVLRGLVRAEIKLLVSILVFARVVGDITEREFLVVGAPRVGEDRVWWRNIVVRGLRRLERAIFSSREKPHRAFVISQSALTIRMRSLTCREKGTGLRSESQLGHVQHMKRGKTPCRCRALRAAHMQTKNYSTAKPRQPCLVQLGTIHV